MNLPTPIDHRSLVKNALDIGVGFVDANYIYKNIETYICTRDEMKNRRTVDFGSSIRMISGSIENYIGTNNYSEIGHDVSSLALKTRKGEDLSEPLIATANAHNSSVDISSDNIIDRDYGGEIVEFCKDIQRISSEFTDIRIRFEFDHNFIGKTYHSSDPINNTQIFTLDILKVSLSKRSSKGTIETSLAFGGVTADSLSMERIRDRMSESSNYLKEVEKAKPINHGRYSTILSNDSAWTLIHETVGHGIEGDEVVNGNSFLKGFKGQIISNLELNVLDDSQIPSAGWSEFDDEGMKTKGILIVDNGELSQFLHSRRTAAILGELPTGNGRISNYLSVPKPRQTNLMIEPGEWTEEEMFEFIGEGVYIGQISHAQVTSDTGEFVMIPEYAYTIQNGELGDPIIPQMIRGQTLDTLQNIEAVGNDIKTNPTECIKNGLVIPIGMISPKLVVSNLEVA